MRRIFWLAVGLGAGATAVVMVNRWAERQARRMAPANVANQVSSAVREFGQLVSEAAREFRAGMAEKEAEIRAAIG